MNDPYAGNKLCRHRCNSRSAHSHMKHIDQDRIQNDINYRSDHHRHRSDHCVSLGINERIQSQRKLDKNGSEQINSQILGRVGQCFRIRAKQNQKRLQKEQADRHHDNRDGKQQRDRIAEIFLCLFLIALPQSNRSQRRSTHTRQTAEGCDQHRDRKCQADPAQRKRTISRHMANVHAVYNAVKRIHQLCRRCRNCQPD